MEPTNRFEELEGVLRLGASTTRCSTSGRRSCFTWPPPWHSPVTREWTSTLAWPKTWE